MEPLRQDIARKTSETARLGERLDGAYQRFLQLGEKHVIQLGDRLEGNSYESVLKRGYAVVWDDAGRLVTSAQAAPGSAWTVEMADGKTPVTVGATSSVSAKPKAKATQNKVCIRAALGEILCAWRLR